MSSGAVARTWVWVLTIRELLVEVKSAGPPGRAGQPGGYWHEATRVFATEDLALGALMKELLEKDYTMLDISRSGVMGCADALMGGCTGWKYSLTKMLVEGGDKEEHAAQED